MIENFRIVSGSTVPFLDVQITKDGIVPLAAQAPSFDSCEGGKQTLDPNVLNLCDPDNPVASVAFQMFKCGRTPTLIASQGVASVLQEKVVEGAGTDSEVTNFINYGMVRYEWHPDDTSVKGLYYGRFVLTFDDGRNFIWPYQLESLTIGVL